MVDKIETPPEEENTKTNITMGRIIKEKG